MSRPDALLFHLMTVPYLLLAGPPRRARILAAELPNLEVACARSADAGDGALAVSVLRAGHHVWSLRGPWVQAARLAERVAQKERLKLRRGVYTAVSGPNLETRAEYRWLRATGADIVGMSTVPEAIVAAHCGMRTCALSVVTDLCFPDALHPIDVPDIIATANAAAPKLEDLLLALLRHA